MAIHYYTTEILNEVGLKTNYVVSTMMGAIDSAVWAAEHDDIVNFSANMYVFQLCGSEAYHQVMENTDSRELISKINSYYDLHEMEVDYMKEAYGPYLDTMPLFNLIKTKGVDASTDEITAAMLGTMKQIHEQKKLMDQEGE